MTDNQFDQLITSLDRISDLLQEIVNDTESNHQILSSQLDGIDANISLAIASF